MERNAYFDNAKILLIFLVVFGHMIQPFTDGLQGISTLYMWIYTFHMPAFIFVAGFFAKGSGNIKYIIKLAKKLLIPYILFQSLYTGYYYLIGKSDWQSGIFYPQWSLWFLISLFCWHILLILFKKIPPYLSVTLAVGLGLFVGFFGQIGHTYSLSRTFVFFPFFLLGFWLREKHVMWLKQKSIKILSIIIMLSLAALIYVAPEINSGWLLASKSYSDLGLPAYGVYARLLVYLTSTLMAVSVFAWIPEKRMMITDLGSRTLYVYLLHGFFIQYFREIDLFHVDHFFDVFGLGIISAAIVFILSSKPVLSLGQPFVEASMSRIKTALQKYDEYWSSQ